MHLPELTALRQIALLWIILLPAVAAAEPQPTPEPIEQKRVENGYQLIQWTDLMPEEDLQALLNPPEYLDEIVDGSPEDQLNNQDARSIGNAKDDKYQQALVSKRIRPEYDQRKVKIPGYIVPLSFDDNMVINEFFLVPFFGACLHVPPPPPNQMIYITYKKGLTLESLYDPFFLEGTIVIKEHKTDEMGTAAYSLNVAKVYPYTE